MPTLPRWILRPLLVCCLALGLPGLTGCGPQEDPAPPVGTESEGDLDPAKGPGGPVGGAHGGSSLGG